MPRKIVCKVFHKFGRHRFAGMAFACVSRLRTARALQEKVDAPTRDDASRRR